jgi:hypothetical protein
MPLAFRTVDGVRFRYTDSGGPAETAIRSALAG